MAALDEVKRRGDTVLADQRPVVELLAALIEGESGQWVAACAARWSLDSGLPFAPLLAAFQVALVSPAAPLREAAALALANCVPTDAPKLLTPLAQDAARSVSRTVRALLLRFVPRATA
jgi:hypothetical protein